MDLVKVKKSKLERKVRKLERLERELKVSLQCERALVRMIVKTCTLMEVMGERLTSALKDDERIYFDAVMQDYQNILDAYSIERSGVDEAQQAGEEQSKELVVDGQE